uniref:HSF-type DNA-binding domain-containing protein n=1 Tax=Arcella intermedia TaxID=1963864 RepID=A0A6B2L359_9EUKA
MEDGDGFKVVDPRELSSSILPKYFNGTLCSFVRQLNLYGFNKIGDDFAFKHYDGLFKRGNEDKLQFIERRKNVKSRGRSESDLSSKQQKISKAPIKFHETTKVEMADPGEKRQPSPSHPSAPLFPSLSTPSHPLEPHTSEFMINWLTSELQHQQRETALLRHQLNSLTQYVISIVNQLPSVSLPPFNGSGLPLAVQSPRQPPTPSMPRTYSNPSVPSPAAPKGVSQYQVPSTFNLSNPLKVPPSTSPTRNSQNHGQNYQHTMQINQNQLQVPQHQSLQGHQYHQSQQQQHQYQYQHHEQPLHNTRTPSPPFQTPSPPFQSTSPPFQPSSQQTQPPPKRISSNRVANNAYPQEYEHETYINDMKDMKLSANTKHNPLPMEQKYFPSSTAQYPYYPANPSSVPPLIPQPEYADPSYPPFTDVTDYEEGDTRNFEYDNLTASYDIDHLNDRKYGVY